MSGSAEEEISQMDQLPTFSSVSVLSCQIRCKYTEGNSYAIMTSRINVVSYHTAATLQVRTVYSLQSLFQNYVPHAVYNIPYCPIKKSAMDVRVTPFQQITAANISQGFPGFNMGGLAAVSTAGKQPRTRKAKKRANFMREDTWMLTAAQDSDPGNGMPEASNISPSRLPYHGKYQSAAENMCFKGDSSKMHSTQETSSDAVQRWKTNLLRSAREFLADLDTWTCNVSRSKKSWSRASFSTINDTVGMKKTAEDHMQIEDNAAQAGKRTEENKDEMEIDSAGKGSKDDMDIDSAGKGGSGAEGSKDGMDIDSVGQGQPDTTTVRGTQGQKRVAVGKPPGSNYQGSPFSTTGYAQRMREGSQLMDLALTLGSKHPFRGRTCLGPSESLQVIREQGLLGQGSAVLAAAVLG
jgi:hypothetical protein